MKLLPATCSLIAAAFCLLPVACREPVPGTESAADSSQERTQDPARSSPGVPPARGIAPTNQRVFQVEGVVREVLAARRRVRIAHEEIPGFMAAMTMPFDVKDARELEGLAPGDRVSFRMVVTPAEGWIEQIVKLPARDAAPPQPEFRVVRDVEPLEIGDLVPDYHFTNHLGRPVSLHDFRGRTVAVTFFYTRCLFPNFCPRMSGNFAAAQEKLKAMTGAPGNWQLFSVTFDPEFDTPRVLALYSRQYQADPARWQFLTGALVEITAFAEQLGMLFWRSDPGQPTSIDHNLVTAVIDPNGRLHSLITGNEWKVDYLVSTLLEAARTSSSQPPAKPPPVQP